MVKAGYKQTEIGVIPEDWDVVKVETIAKLGGGTTPSRSKEFYFKNGYINWVKTTDLNNYQISKSEEKLTDEAINETNLKIHPKNSILVAMYGGFNQIGRTGLLVKEASINQALVAILPNESVYSSMFLLFYLNYKVDRWKSVASSSRKDPNITSKDVKNFLVSMPSTIEEQEAIAEALSDVDGLIGALEALIEKKRQIKTGAMQQLLTGKTRLPGFGEGKGKGKGFKQTELGEIPEDWEIVNFSKLAEIDPENLGSNTDSNYAFNYISLEDASRGKLRGFSEQIFQSSPSRARRILKDRDVLFGTVRPNLKSHYLFENHNGNWICSTGFAVLRAKEKIADPGFIFYSLFSRAVEKQIDTLIAGSNYPAVNSRDVNQLIIAKPNFDEQQAISKIIKGFDVEVGALEQRLAKTKALKQGMMQELLTGRTRLI